MNTNDWKKLVESNEHNVIKALEKAFAYAVVSTANVVITDKGDVAVIEIDGTPDDTYALLYMVDPADVYIDVEESKDENPEKWVYDAIYNLFDDPKIQNAIAQNIVNGVKNYNLTTSDGKPDFYRIVEQLSIIDRRAADKIFSYEAKEIAAQKAKEMFEKIMDAGKYKIANGISSISFLNEAPVLQVNNLFEGTQYEKATSIDSTFIIADKIQDAIDNGELDIGREKQSRGQEK